jgi:disulfide oxidoreductase YuzD
LTKNIQVTIINDPARQDCDASCGIDWSLRESLELAEEQVRNRFGERVCLTYLDLTGKEKVDSLIEWGEKIVSEKLSVPLLILNGRLRITGNFDIRQMLDVIEAELEIGV